MNDGTSYSIQFIWLKKDKKGTQWIVGTEVGYFPTAQTTLEYQNNGMASHQYKGLMSSKNRKLISTFSSPLILISLHIGNLPQTGTIIPTALPGI